jgi:hypothetical protein
MEKFQNIFQENPKGNTGPSSKVMAISEAWELFNPIAKTNLNKTEL